MFASLAQSRPSSFDQVSESAERHSGGAPLIQFSFPTHERHGRLAVVSSLSLRVKTLLSAFRLGTLEINVSE